MSHGAFYIPRLFKYLPRDLEGRTILDAGMGLGEMGYYIRAFSDRPSCDFHGQPYIVGLDIHEPSINFAKTYLDKIYNEAYYLDLIDIESFFKGKHFDIATILEVPEHIEKKKMLRILDQIEALTDYILIATPYGDELNQDFGDKIPEFNHVSVWMPEDFQKRGYTVAVEDVVQIRSRLLYPIYRFIRKMMTGRDVQQDIIAVRNRRGVTTSRGIAFGGLKEAEKWK